MAEVPPPKRGTKGTPPASAEIMNNLSMPETNDLVPLNFKVAREFRIEFKTYASRLGISMKELLERSFQEYKQAHS